MSYTYKSLALVWLIVFGLVALSGSGMVVGPWVLLLVVTALAMPALVLTLNSTPRTAVGATVASYGRGLEALDVRRLPRLPSNRVDVYRWENEGGA